MRKTYLYSIFLIIFVLLSGTIANGEEKASFNEKLLEAFSYRALGPAEQGGRIVDIAVPVAQPYTFYIASASGGLWKTVNNGTTFEPIFDNQNVISIGDIALAPSSPDIIWVGTGEAANSRSAYWGDGVYRSSDGGKTWEHMGLKETHHIGRIVIHPQDTDIVYVAALGHLYSFNKERGLFKTTDGGKTWEKVLYINERVGVVDVVMNPNNPNILLAATYEKKRLPWTFEESGTGSAVYRSEDGGTTWTKITAGLPGGKLGRIGLDNYLKDPNIIYATVENANPIPPTESQIKRAKERGRKPRTRTVGGEIYRSEDGGLTWKKMNSDKNNIGGQPGYYYGQIRVDPNDDQAIYVLSVGLYYSEDGGKSWRSRRGGNAAPMVHSDHHALWIDPANSRHMILGNDGGIAVSYDKGTTWEVFEHLPLAQYYAIGVDMEDPYNVYGGLQDNGSWKGPSLSLTGTINKDSWVIVGGGDGFYNQIDPEDSRWLYNESQFGMIQRINQKTGEKKFIRPSKEGGLRFNWNTPIHISPHNSRIIYVGTNILFRSLNRGEDWQEISPDLTLNDPVKIAGIGNIQYCTITTISESPIKPGLIWVGTDDGKVHLTRNGGSGWTDLTSSLAKARAPVDYWVSRVFASRHHEGTAFITKTGYRRDVFKPFIFKTTDYGKTWISIAADLPDEPINVVFEDQKNKDLLFVGTEKAVYVTIDGGGHWVRMRNNMPTNAVHDLLIHPRENDLVVGTHGRGIFITNISPLQELNAEILEKDVFLFAVDPVVKRIIRRGMSFPGHKHYSVPNEKGGVTVYYYLKEDVDEKVKITITDPYGNTLKTITGKKLAGIHSANWNMSRKPGKVEIQARRRSMGDMKVEAGEYVAVLVLGEKKMTQKIRIKDYLQ
jgi:photosystem II stability/assembly factor-like uncharacterized protein